MSNITIKQIAERAGVSTSAVSFALNGRKGISEKTRNRVLDIIKELEYTPNVNSRRLILQRSFNIILAIDTSMSPLDNFFYAAIVKSVVNRGTELGYNVVLSANYNKFSGSALESTLSQGNADGIIFLHDICFDLQVQLDKFQTPYIVVDSQLSNPQYPCVRGDYELSCYTATKYLISKGHTKIAFIGVGAIPEFYIRSFNGYKSALSESDLTVQLDWIQSDAKNEETAKSCMAKILESPVLPTAIFCAGDVLAIGAMNYLQNRGYRIPDDFSFCSIDDILLSRYYFPSLTTISIDVDRMGCLAVNILNDIINNKEDVKTIVTVPSDKLSIRNSVKDLSDK